MNLERWGPGRHHSVNGVSPAEARPNAFMKLLLSPGFRLTVLAVVIAAGVVAAVVSGGPSKAGLEDAVRSAGVAAPVLYVALYVVLTVLLVPGTVLTTAGGVLFGVVLGTILSVIGAVIGSVIAFYLARRLGREQVEQIAGPRVEKLDAWISRNGFLAVLYVRLIPFFPFNVLNYAAGVTSVRGRSYVLGTAIGIIPGTFAYTALGGTLDEPTSPAFLAAVGLVVGLAVVAPLAQRIARHRGLGPDAD